MPLGMSESGPTTASEAWGLMGARAQESLAICVDLPLHSTALHSIPAHPGSESHPPLHSALSLCVPPFAAVMNPLLLALQPPSLHNLPSHSRSPFTACTHSRSPSASTTPAASSHSLIHRHLAPHPPGTKAVSDADSAPASIVSQRRDRLYRCTSLSSNLSLLAVQPPCDVSASLSPPDTCLQSGTLELVSSIAWKSYFDAICGDFFFLSFKRRA